MPPRKGGVLLQRWRVRVSLWEKEVVIVCFVQLAVVMVVVVLLLG
jgi:hypothetical protein